MEKNKPKGKFSSDFSLVVTTLVALLLVVFHEHAERGTLSFQKQNTPDRNPASSLDQSPNTQSPMDMINRGLKNVYDVKHIQRERAQLEKSQRPRNLNQSDYVELEKLKREAQAYGLQLQPINPAEEIARKNEQPLRMDYDQLDSEVSRNLAARELLQQHDEAYRREFIRQFVENARKDGLDVILNKDLSIKEVRPLSQGSR